MPRDIVRRMNQEVVQAVRTREVSERLAHEGAEIIGNTPEEAQAIVKRDVAQWAAVIEKLGLRSH